MSYADFQSLPEDLRRVIDSARTDGEVIVRVDGRVVARVVPMEEVVGAKRPRVPGDMKGKIWAAEDAFDEDPEITRLFEESDAEGLEREGRSPV